MTRAAVGLALVAIAIIYGPTIGYELVNYDDPWLVENNWILNDPSVDSLRRIWTDFDRETRFVLGSEYLPVRDLSIMLDSALWGRWYGGFHLTNVLLYATAVVVWMRALIAWGIEPRTAALALLVWTVLPVHVESVAWITERKGLLACVFAGVATLGAGHFRAGRSTGWLVLGSVAGVLAVWSKAPAAFALAALGGLELVLPERRVAWRRSIAGLAAIAVPAAAAFVPVLVVANAAEIVGAGDHAPAGTLEMALGLHGFYVRLAAMTVPNAVSYPIATRGPDWFDVVLGALALVAVVLPLALRPRGRFQPSPAIRAAAVVWLANWFPISRLVLPLQAVLVADRYLLLPTLGLALVIATAANAIDRPAIRRLLVAAIVLAGIARSLDARDNWEHDTALWRRATESNPYDGNAWGSYVQALMDDGDPAALAALREGLRHVRAPELLVREAINLEQDRPAEAIALLQEAANGGSGHAAMNLAILLGGRGESREALAWARRATAMLPMRAYAHRMHGNVAAAANELPEAATAYERALELEPANPGARCELGKLYERLDRAAAARPLLAACKAR